MRSLTHSSGIHTSMRPNGTALRSAFGAESAENEFTFANNPLTEGALGGLWHVVPINVLDSSAAVADEVMMEQAFGIESRCAALDRHFTDQARLHKIPQIVIRRGP